MHSIALFCSGSGTNAQFIIDHFAAHASIKVVCLLANKAGVYSLERARQAGLPTLVFTRRILQDTTEVDAFLQSHGVTAIVMAGFLLLLPARLLAAYPAQVVNIHPALLPDFGGPGMFGHHVHEAVSASGRDQTGITIHLADPVYDHGRIIFQAAVSIAAYADPAQIEQTVRALELVHYAPIVEAYLEGRLL